MKTVDFTGTVSQATTRVQDLVPAFMDVLWKYHPKAYILATEGMLEVFDLSYTDLCSQPFHMAWQSSEMGYLLHEVLWDARDEIAPEGYYFGAHAGDGCDYGFWRIKDWEDNEPGCHFCGRSDLTLLTCPKCNELLCQDHLDGDARVCEPR